MNGKPSRAPVSNEDAKNEPEPSIAVLAQVSDAMKGLKYGQISIIIQDSVVVQIDRLEKYRLTKPD